MSIRKALGLRTHLRTAQYRRKWGFDPPPPWADISGYETLLDELERHGISRVEGDIVEIGVFRGGGTYKLSKYFERVAPDKRVYAIDVFDPSFDQSPTLDGNTMAEGYAAVLNGQDQRESYDEVTRSCTNVTTIASDSAKVTLPTQKLAYAHIDGNHEPAYVHSDFKLVWPAVSNGGIVSIDDYGSGDEAGLDHVNHAVHEVIGEHASEIAELWTDGFRTIFLKKG